MYVCKSDTGNLIRSSDGRITVPSQLRNEEHAVAELKALQESAGLLGDFFEGDLDVMNISELKQAIARAESKQQEARQLADYKQQAHVQDVRGDLPKALSEYTSLSELRTDVRVVLMMF